jgi:hypothetical protein
MGFDKHQRNIRAAPRSNLMPHRRFRADHPLGGEPGVGIVGGGVHPISTPSVPEAVA